MRLSVSTGKTRILCGDAVDRLQLLPDESVHCCVTSPPYWGLRDYGVEGQIGLEPTPEAFIEKMVAVFREVKRVLTKDGTCWINIGDSYNAYNGGAGPSSSISRGAQTNARPKLETGYGLRAKDLKPKDLIGIPWMLAFALRADGWHLRQEIIWNKPNPMPESVRDRCTKAHEHIFLLTKNARYYFDSEAIRESVGERNLSSWAGRKASEPTRRGDPGISGHVTTIATLASREGRNKRSVWTITPKPYKGAHFATFPPDLVEPCILAGCPEGGTVLDPFGGSDTTAAVANNHNRRCILIELNPNYIRLMIERLHA